MNVSFIGNLNNIAYELALHLRDRKIEAKVLDDFSSENLYRPSDTCAGFHGDLLEQQSALSLGAFLENPATCDTVLKEKATGFVIGSGFSAAMLSHAGLQMSAFLALGNDTLRLPFELRPWFGGGFGFTKQLLGVRSWASLGAIRRLPELQRRGIQQSKWLLSHDSHYLPPHHRFPNVLRVRAIPNTYPLTQRSLVDHERPSVLDRYVPARYGVARRGPIILMPAKHDFAYKGTDKFIHLYSHLRQHVLFRDALLLTFDWGPDRVKARRLLEALPTSAYAFLPFLPKRDLQELMAACDLMFSNWSSVQVHLNGVISMALSAGLPIVGHIPQEYVTAVGESYPMVKVGTGTDRWGSTLTTLLDAAHLKQIGREGQGWYVKAATETLDVLVDLIQD